MRNIYYKDYIQECQKNDISPRRQLCDIIRVIKIHCADKKNKPNPHFYELYWDLLDLDRDLINGEEISLTQYCIYVMNIIEDMIRNARIKSIENNNGEMVVTYTMTEKKRNDVKLLHYIYNELEVLSFRLVEERYW